MYPKREQVNDHPIGRNYLNKHIYFPGLNGIRFLAALYVVFWHIEQFKGDFNLSDGTNGARFFLARISMPGTDAVTLFFVLSGFLITYLLLAEIELSGTVNVKSFYVRRSLRIWPLYFLIVLIGFLAIPIFIKIIQYDGYYPGVSSNFLHKLSLYLLFLPNVAQLFFYYPLGASHLWTIGIEEYFYVIWPVLVKYFRKNILPAIAGIILFRVIFVVIFYYRFSFPDYALNFLESQSFYFMVINQFPFENMAIGGLGAYILYHNHQRLLNMIFHPITVWSTLLLMSINVFFMEFLVPGTYLGWANHFGRATMYTLFIMNMSANPAFPLKLENKVYTWLGKRSYGIYMYHPVIIYLTFIFFDLTGQADNSFQHNIILYTIITALTIIVSHLSYQYFEKPFLSFKQKFTIIQSGEANLANQNIR